MLAQAQAAITRGAFAEALERIGEAEALAPGPDDQQAIVARFVRAQLLMTLGRHAEAEPQFLGVINSLGRMTEPVPPLVRFLVTANLGTLYQRQERLVEAEEVFTRGLEEGEMLAQAQPPDPAAAGIVMTARNNLAFLYTSQAEAEQLSSASARRARRGLRRTIRAGPPSPSTSPISTRPSAGSTRPSASTPKR